MKELLIILVNMYQVMLAPFMGGRCRYVPTCSDYMKEALHTHGSFHGVACGLKRILRCHPWGRYGLDPVPPTASDRFSHL